MLADHLLKTKKECKQLKKQGSQDIYQNKLDKACFQHDIAYGDLKNLPRETASDKELLDKTFNTAKNSKYGGCQRGIASVVFNFFVKSLLVVPLKVKLCQTNNYPKNSTN